MKVRRASQQPATAATATATDAGPATTTTTKVTATTTIAGAEASSGSDSRSDSASFEHKRCHTGGQQQQQHHQQQHKHNNGPNNWTNRFHNNWRYSPNPNNNHTNFQNNYNNNGISWQHNNNSNNNWCEPATFFNSEEFNFYEPSRREAFRQNVYQPYINPQQRRMVNEQQEKNENLRNSSANRAVSKAWESAVKNNLQSKREPSLSGKNINEKHKDKEKKSEKKSNEKKEPEKKSKQIKVKQKTLQNPGKKDKKSTIFNQTEVSEETNATKNLNQSKEQTNVVEENDLNQKYLQITNEKDHRCSTSPIINQTQTAEDNNSRTSPSPTKKIIPKRKSEEQSQFNAETTAVKAKLRKKPIPISVKQIRSKAIEENKRRAKLVRECAKKNQSEGDQETKQHDRLSPQEEEKETTATHTYPTIQVRPLTELLKQEILAVTQEQLLANTDAQDEITPKSVFRSEHKSEIRARRQTISSSCINSHSTGNKNGEFNINDRLANMDKESLKYIINNSDTIYNEHLKLQARRRLRDEIRRQLKEIKLDQPKDKPTKELVEDEIVDAIKLPQLLLKEIEKCFGIEISVPELEESAQCSQESSKCSAEVETYSKESEQCSIESEQCSIESEEWNRQSQQCSRENEQYNREREQCRRENEQCNRESQQCSRENEQCNKESEQCRRENEQCNRESEQCNRENEQCNRESEQCNRECDKYISDIEEINKESEQFSTDHTDAQCTKEKIFSSECVQSIKEEKEESAKVTFDIQQLLEESAKDTQDIEQLLEESAKDTQDIEQLLEESAKDTHDIEQLLEESAKDTHDIEQLLEESAKDAYGIEQLINENDSDTSDTEQSNKESKNCYIKDTETQCSIESEQYIKTELCNTEQSEIEMDLNLAADVFEHMAKTSSSDLITCLKVAEQSKALTGKTSNHATVQSPVSKSTSKGSPQKDQLPDTIVKSMPIKIEIKTESNCSAEKDSVIVLSSSEDEDDEEQDNTSQVNIELNAAASDHSSNSNSSNDVEAKRRYNQKLQNDADNVVDSFEKLILPQLKDSLAERYRNSHCANLQTRLHFISCVVTSTEHNSQTFSKIQVAKMQQNLKTSDNRLGIEFLLREIINVVNMQKQTALARRKQGQEQPTPNELTTATALLGNDVKNAELASEAHQSGSSDVEAAEPNATPVRALMPPTPPRNGTPTPTHVATPSCTLHALSLGLPQLALDTTLPRISPSSYPLTCGLDPNDPLLSMNDSVLHNLLEIDRRLLENQNRRGFLEEMIMKFQKEKNDLETLSLELQSRKFLLLNSVIRRHHATAATPPPTNSPPPNAALLANSSPAGRKLRPRQRRAVIVKRVKILSGKRGRPPKRVKSSQTQDAAVNLDDQTDLLSDEVESKESTTTSQSIPQPIKMESDDETKPNKDNDAAQKRAKNSTAITSPNRQRLSRSCSMNAAQQPLAVIPPLPPPPPPPEPFANMSYDLPRVLLKPTAPVTSSEAHLCKKISNFNYGFIPGGRLHHITSPITQIRIYKVYIIAAAENGDVYMFNIGNHKLERQITKHSEAITNMFLCEKESFLYTTSLDGFLKKSSLENLERVMQTVYLKEPLQSIDIAWGIAFIGSRWGNIFTYNIAANKVMDMPLLSTGQSIIAVKATKEGVRKIIMLGCKGNFVFLHDAATGLLLRRLNVPEGLNVYSLLLTDGHVFCGTQKNVVYKFDFATGSMTTTMSCGNGAVAMATYGERYLLIGCYDGFIYVLDKENGRQLGRFSGAGRLVLALAIAGDKVVTSSKDNTLVILEIPPELLSVDQGT